MKRYFKLLEKMLLISAIILKVAASFEVNAQKYTPTWESVNTHNPAPEWFQDAKFGIYWHWGAFTTPEYGSEWYPRLMLEQSNRSKQAAYQHHFDTYGDPKVWMYHNFINGAYDRKNNRVEFAPKLKSAGGKFDPDEYAQLCADAGAKFAGPVAEHHDGYSMWKSKVNEWNSYDKGPHLDLVKLFTDALRTKGLKVVLTSHAAFNFQGFFEYVAPQTDLSLKKLYGQLDKDTESQLWYDKLKELIDNYNPDIIWHDIAVGGVGEKQQLEFLSYYYNNAIKWGNKDVVVTCKDGFGVKDLQKGVVYDFEQGGPKGVSIQYFLTDDCVSYQSWSYVSGMPYYTKKAILHNLIDRVSKNGNLLLSISPKADGTIPQEQKDILYALGSWLKINGEAIYSTRAWTTFGEGPSKLTGPDGQQQEGTLKDIRFTRNKANNVLYAIVLGWPEEQLEINSLKSGSINISVLKNVQLLDKKPGEYIDLPTRTQDGTGLKVKMPANKPYEAFAYVVKLTFNGEIPQ